VPKGNFDPEAEKLVKIARAAELTERDLRAVTLMSAGVIDTKIAKEIGVSQGYFSKLKPRIIEKLRQGRKKLYGAETDDREVWSDINVFFEGEGDD
jgi:DNA-binding CsgD family transcriptional regulator